MTTGFSRFQCKMTKLDQWEKNFFYSVDKVKFNCTSQTLNLQECIPVGCTSPAADTICWGVSASLQAGIHPPLHRGWAWRPPQVWAWRPPQQDPSTSPLGVGLETTPRPDPQPPSWVWAWRSLLWTEFLTYARKYYLAQSSLRTVIISFKNASMVLFIH